MRIPDQYTLATCLHQPLSLPLRQHTADGIECGPRHLGQILSCECEFDATSRFDSQLRDKPQQDACDTTFHFFSGEFTITLLHLLNVCCHEFHQIHGKIRTSLHEFS